MAMTAGQFPEAELLEKTPATDVRRKWKVLQAKLRSTKRVALTSHDTVEAVMLTPEEYESLVARARGADDQKLAVLKQRFQDRLASLQASDARDRIESIFAKAGTLDKPIISGDSY